MVDAFVPFIVEQLKKHPDLRSSRLFVMIKERGYPGGPDHLRRVVGRLRLKKPAEAFQRLRTMPGEQGQVEWAHFGKLEIGRAQRPLWAFVMVLSYSRRLFLRFFPGASLPFFVRGHVEAFADFGGVPRVLLYHNLKSAVLECHGDAIMFHPTLLEMSAHYRFEPRPVAIARGNEKGRLERCHSLRPRGVFAARTFTDPAVHARPISAPSTPHHAPAFRGDPSACPPPLVLRRDGAPPPVRRQTFNGTVPERGREPKAPTSARAELEFTLARIASGLPGATICRLNWLPRPRTFQWRPPLCFHSSICLGFRFHAQIFSPPARSPVYRR